MFHTVLPLVPSLMELNYFVQVITEKSYCHLVDADAFTDACIHHIFE